MEELRAQLRVLWERGDSIRACAEALDTSTGAIDHHRRAMGLPGRVEFTRHGPRNPASAELNERILALHRLGMSRGQIGRDLGVSKGTVSGRLERLDTAAKPAGERRGGGPRARPPLPPGAGLAVTPLAPIEAVVAAPVVEDVAPRPPLVTLRTSVTPGAGCCWVEGEPRRWRYCDAPAVGRGPYCAEHHARSVGGGTRSERDAA